MGKAKTPAAKPAKTRLVPISKYTGDPANLRIHPEDQRRMTEASIRAHKPFRSIAVDGENIVRAGNETIRAAQAAGVTHVLEVESDGSYLVAVKRKDLKGVEAMAAGLADNRISELSRWDAPALGDVLLAFHQQNHDLESLGFTEDAAGKLLRSLDGDRGPSMDAPIATGTVTQGDMTKAQEGIDGRYTGTQHYSGVTCPKCGAKIYLDADANG